MHRAFSDQLLVFEITKRCAIWDSSSSEFYDEQLKKAAWREVVEVFSRPGDSLQTKRNLESYLQLKWEQARRQSSNEVRQMIVVCKGFLENSTGPHRENLHNLIQALKYCDEFDDEDSEIDQKFILTGITDSEPDFEQSSSDSSDSELVNDLSKKLRRMLLQKDEPATESAKVESKRNKNKTRKQVHKKVQSAQAPESRQQQPRQPDQPQEASAQAPQPRGSGSTASRRGRRGRNNAQQRQKSYSKASRSLV